MGIVKYITFLTRLSNPRTRASIGEVVGKRKIGKFSAKKKDTYLKKGEWEVVRVKFWLVARVCD